MHEGFIIIQLKKLRVYFVKNTLCDFVVKKHTLYIITYYFLFNLS